MSDFLHFDIDKTIIAHLNEPLERQKEVQSFLNRINRR